MEHCTHVHEWGEHPQPRGNKSSPLFEMAPGKIGTKWYTSPMHQLDQQIIDILNSPDPPKTSSDLIARCDKGKNYVLSRITYLLKQGLLTTADMPWRTDERRSVLKPKNPLADLDRRLNAIANLNEGDRVSALKALIDLRTLGTEVSGPPAPNDLEGMTAALVNILQSAGRELCDTALLKAFPPHDILLPQEAPDATEAQTHLAGPANGRDNLD